VVEALRHFDERQALVGEHLCRHVEEPGVEGDRLDRVDLGDLDECNGRWCVTPEFPNGTYAYFTTVKPDGAPAYPYNMGRRYHGNPVGRVITAIAEPVTTNFVTLAATRIASVKTENSTVSLVWKPDTGHYDTTQK